MSFKLKVESLTELFNPDDIHRGISLEKLKKMGRIAAFESLLKTHFQKGLINDIKQHERRRKFYGENVCHTKKQPTLWQLISKNFDDQLIRLMVVAGLVSLVLGVLTEGLKWGWIEGMSIFFAVALVIFLSSINDYAHEKSFQLIKGKLGLKLIRVYRGGRLFLIDPKELMVGDIIQIMGGDQIEVDGLLISGQDLTLDESQITGQAIDVKKRVPITYQRHEGSDPFILSSSKVMSGMGIMLVLAVGKNSYYGNLTTKMDEDHVDSPLKIKLTDLSNQINDSGFIVGVITFSSLILHYLYGCFKEQDAFNSIWSVQTVHELVKAILITFTIDVALPESLPLLVTIALSKTAKQLQKSNIFVKHLNDCETMGSVDNLCLSKTGFVSKNLLSVAQIYVEQRIVNIVSREIMSQSTCKLLNLAIIMNTTASPKFIESQGKTLKIQHIGNKTESALLEMSYRMGYNYQRFRMNSKIKRIYSSSAPKKKMGTIYKDEKGKIFLFIKGSPKLLLSYCRFHINRYEKVQSINLAVRQQIQNAIEHFSKANQKIIMIAYKEINGIPSKWSQVQKNFVLISIVGIKDLIRQGVKKTVQECEKFGITVRMLSNQNRNNAIGAAKTTGILPDQWIEKTMDYTIIEGCDFRELVSGLTKEDKNSFERKLAFQNFKMIKETLKVIYRAQAQDKLLLAIGLKQCGNIVAVAGNGTNDTEALRKSDVSIAMGLTCNQTAKDASDIVILDDKFSSIISTIKWGRHTVNTVKKFLTLQLTINLVAAVMALLGAVFVGESPLHPLQFLWINLVIDLLGSISLILEKPHAKDLNSKPYPRREKLLTSDMSKMIISQSTIQVIVLSFIMFSSPQVFGYVSSVGVEEWNKQTGKHYSIFFNTFVLLQIFNEFNVRCLKFQNINVFQGLGDNPLFLCFSVISFILQFVIIKYGGKLLHTTQLSFKQNLLCFILGSLSVTGLYLIKVLTPKHIKIANNGLQFGIFSYYWGQKFDTNIQKPVEDYIPLPEAELEALSPQFSNFLRKRRTKYAFSYIEQKDTIRDSFEFAEESVTEDEEKF